MPPPSDTPRRPRRPIKRPPLPRAPKPRVALAHDVSNAHLEAQDEFWAALERAKLGADSTLARDAVERSLAYLDTMLEENKKLNLTAIRDASRARILHVLDSLTIWHFVGQAPELIVDLGSGNGFPGAVAAALWPEAKVVCVERTQKKARAIARCAERAALDNVEALPMDAAAIPKLVPTLRARAELVLSRAMADLKTVTKLAAPLLSRRRALLVQWKSRALERSERVDGEYAARDAHLDVCEDYVYTLPGDEAPGGEARVRRLIAYVRRPRA